MLRLGVYAMPTKPRLNLFSLLLASLAWVGASLGAPIVVEDLTTLGSWTGKYGADGYILPAFYNSSSDVVSLPAYVSSWNWTGINRWNWATNTGQARAVVSPDGSTRNAGCFYGGGTMTFTVNLNQAKTFNLGFYLLDWDSTSRTERLSVAGYTDVNASGFNPGKWYTFQEVSGAPGSPVTMTFTHTGGANAVISAIMFDPKPGPNINLTWDGTVNDWTTSHWLGSPPTWPDSTVGATVNAGDVRVDRAERGAYWLQQGGGQVTVDVGNTLLLPNGITSTAGTVALRDRSTLRLDNAGGSIVNLAVTGDATVHVGAGTLDVANLTMASSLEKTGGGTLALPNVTAAPGSIVEAAGGTTRIGGPGYISAADLVLSGGTVEISGTLAAVPGLMGGSRSGNPWTGTPNPGNLGVALGPDGLWRENGPGQTQREAAWRATRADGGTGPDNTTLIYTGEVYLGGTTTFVEQNDDVTILTINGVQLINNGSWNDAIRATYTPPAPGWYSFDMRLSNGGGGYGFFGQQGGGGDSNWDNAAVQYGFRYAAGTIGDENALSYQPARDPGDGSLFRVASRAAIDMTTTPVWVTQDTTGSRIVAVTDAGTAALGPLTFGRNSDLTLTGARFTFPSVAFGQTSALTVPSQGAALGNVTTNGGEDRLGASGAVSASTWNDQGVRAGMLLTGSTTLILDNTVPGTIVADASTFGPAGTSTLRGLGIKPLGAGGPNINLQGGTLLVQGNSILSPGMLRERLFDYDGAVYLNPIDSGSGFLVRGDYIYEGMLTGNLAFNGDHWQNAPGNFGAKGLNGWDNIGGLWYGKMNIGGSSPLPANSDITLATGSDDGSVFWVDANRNGVYEASELVVNNNYYQGTTWRGGLINLPAGQYNVAIGFYEGGGGEWMEARYAIGNTLNNWGAMTVVNPGSQSAIWAAEKFGPIYMAQSYINVSANSRINAGTEDFALFGPLSFSAPSVLTVAGGGRAYFATTTVNAAGSSGFNTEIPVYAGTLDGKGLAPTILKQGQSDLIFAAGGAGITGGRFEVQAGRLGLIGGTGFGAATANLAGGNIVVGSLYGADETYFTNFTSTANGTITAGSIGGVGAPTGAITIVPPIAPGAGTTITLASQDSHSFALLGGAGGAGSLAFNQTTVGVPAPLNLANLTLNGGTTNLSANATLTGGLVGSGTLATQGNVTINAQQTLSFGGTLRVDSGQLTIQTPAAAAPPPGAVAFWTFDNAGNLGADTMGAYNGTLMGAPLPVQVPGRIGGALDFESTQGNYVDLPDGMANFTNGITVAAWVKYESYSNWNRIIDFGNGAGNNNIVLARRGGEPNGRWEVFNTAGGTETHDFSNNPLLNGQWYHVAATIAPGATNASVSTVYINGVPYDTKYDSTVPPNVTRVNNFIGESNWGGDDFLDGIMDELLVYNRALGAGEVRALYNAGLVGSYAPFIGDVRLAPGTSLTLGGGGVAAATSIGSTTGAPMVTGGITMSNPGSPTLSVNPAGDRLTTDATINATGFNVTGPGTVALRRNLTLTGGLTVASNATLATENSLTVDASAGSVNIVGNLNVNAATTLTMRVAPPVPMPANLTMWLDAADRNGDGTPDNSADGTAVSTWVSRSGSGFRLVAWNNDPYWTPTTVASGIGGKPVVRFQEDYMWSDNYDMNNPFTIFAVSNLIGGDNERLISSRNINWLMGYHGGLQGVLHASGWITHPGPAADTTPDLFASTNTGGPYYQFYWNGNNITGNATGGNDRIGQLALGGYGGIGETSRGDVAEVLIFDRVLNAAELNNVGGYLANKYGLSSSYTGYLGTPDLGNVTLGAGSTLRLNDDGSGQAQFTSITAGNAATIQGHPTLTGDLRPGASPGTLNVIGNLTLAAGSTYHWEHDGTTGDMVNVTGNLTTLGNINLGVSLGRLIPDGTYDVGTVTGSITLGGGVNVVKENPYAQLINSATVGVIPGAPNRVVLAIDMMDNILNWTSNTGTDWNNSAHWTPVQVPTAATHTVVATSNRIATVTSTMPTQAAQSLIVDNAGHVLIEPGGRLQVTENADVMPAGNLTVLGGLKVGSITGPPAGLLSGLIAHWAFDGNLNNDSTYSGFNGTANPSVAYSTNVPPQLGIGQSLQLNGSNWVSVSQPAATPVTGTYTVSAWAQVANNAANNIFDTRRPTEFGFDMKLQNGNLVHGDIGTGGGWLTTAADAALAYSTNTWYHIAYVVTPTGYNLYVRNTSGSLVATGSGSYSGTPVLLDGSHVLNIGRHSGGGENLTGLIDDVAVWNRALTGAELLDVFNFGMVSRAVGGTLTTAGTTYFGPYADIDVPKIDVIGGTTTGAPNQPPVLKTGTTLRLAGGNLAGALALTNPSTTAGSYALEVENGTSSAWLTGQAASLRKSTPGSATFSGLADLNNIRVEAGTLNFIEPASFLRANNITVAGGTLMSSKNTTVGTLALDGGTTILARDTKITTALRGSGTLIADGTFTIDAATAGVGLSGELRVTSTVPAISGALTINTPPIGTPDPNLMNGLRGYWPLNGDVNDYSGNGRNGTAFNGPTWASDAVRASSLRFDGSDDYVTMPALGVSGNAPRTIAGWAKSNDAAGADGDWTGIFGFTPAQEGQGRFFDVEVRGGGAPKPYCLHLYAREDNFGPLTNDPNWHFFAAAYDGTNVRLYTDGSATPVLTYTPSWPLDLYDQFGMGRRVGQNQYFNGQVDDVAAWNRALTGAEIQAFRQGALAGGPARLGDVRLDPGSQLTLGGSAIATLNSMGTTGGPTVAGPMTLAGNANLRGGSQWLTVNGSLDANNFSVTGPAGVDVGVTLLDNLTVASGGSLSVPQGVTLASDGNVTISAPQASINFRGALNVESASLTLVLPAADPTIKPPTDAAAYYSFSNTYTSGAFTWVTNEGTLGSSKNGQLRNQATTTTAGRIGAGMLIPTSGTGAYMRLNEAPSSSIDIATEWTIAAWFNNLWGDDWRTLTRGASNDHQIIVENGSQRLGMYDNAGGGGFRPALDGGGNPVNIAPSSGWHHVAAVGKANGTTDYYVDGVFRGTADRRSTTEVSWIGNGEGWGQEFANVVDEFLVYNRTLTATEIQNLYLAGLQGNYGATRLGDLTMAPNTQLIAQGGPVGFSTASIGHAATLTGDITFDRRFTPNGLNPGSFIVQGAAGPGTLRIGDGAVYEWSFTGPTTHDLISVVGDLMFDKSFTLRLFGEGGTILSTDLMPVFYADNLFVGGLPWNAQTNPLQYTIDIGNLMDPQHLYLWDLSTATLQVLSEERGWGIYLTGLTALAIPEPSTLALLGLGVLALLRRRRGRAA